ncbi:MAG: carbohydrate ABC transporter permease [Bacillota bacterium]|nr:carbohydrate ABC transporter permease [Bacillota bacterium]
MVKKKRPQILLNGIGIVYSLLCIIPFVIVVSASLSRPIDLSQAGYKLIPSPLSLNAYETVFRNPAVIGRSYAVTIFVTVVTVFFGLLFMSMAAYTLSRRNCAFRGALSFYFFFTMLFSGGIVPSYIWITQYLKLQDTYRVMIIPSLINVFYVFMIRTFFQQLPSDIFESAKIDGASEAVIFFRIALPLSKPVLATVAFFTAMGKWNDWTTGLYYLNDARLYPLQYLLYSIQRNIQALLAAMDFTTSGMGAIPIEDVPGENLLMAMAVIATGPMLVVFPLFQKHFVSGLTVGAIKG